MRHFDQREHRTNFFAPRPPARMPSRLPATHPAPPTPQGRPPGGRHATQKDMRACLYPSPRERQQFGLPGPLPGVFRAPVRAHDPGALPGARFPGETAPPFAPKNDHDRPQDEVDPRKPKQNRCLPLGIVLVVWVLEKPLYHPFIAERALATSEFQFSDLAQHAYGFAEKELTAN